MPPNPSSEEVGAEGGTNIPADEADATAEEIPPMSNVPRVPQSTVPLPDEDLIAETRGVPSDAPAEDEDVATPAEAQREEPLPVEERPERREAAPSTDTPREDPPPGEERPVRRGETSATDAPREAPPPGEERPGKRTL